MRFSEILVRSAAAAALSVVPGTAWARDDGQIWTGGAATVNLSDRWRLSAEVIARFSDNRGGLYEIEAPTLLNFRLAKDVTLAGGYVHNPQFADGDLTTVERRAREQITVDNIARVAEGRLSARLRLEQRWRDNADGTGWRVRPYFKYSLPLKGKTSLVLSNETFLNLNTTTFQRQDGLDRMRNLIAVNTPLAKDVTIEAGYLNQYGFVRGGEDNRDHIASILVSASF
jgi:hypothetical protein